MRSALPLLCAPLVLLAGRAAHPGLQVLDLEPLPDDAAVGIAHPTTPLFRVDAEGWPVQGDSGYVALRDEADGVVYSTWQLGAWRGGAPPPGLGKENWGQIDAFACLARAMRELRARRPDHAPVPIGHVSGEHGGFPDLAGEGYSGHVTHQTGLHFNFRLPPLEGVHERVSARPGQPDRFHREELLALLDVLLRHGAYHLVTNRAVVDLAAARTADYPSLALLEAEGSPREGGTLHRLEGGGSLTLFDEPGDHADHCNVVFWPGR